MNHGGALFMLGAVEPDDRFDGLSEIDLNAEFYSQDDLCDCKSGFDQTFADGDS